MEIRLHRSVDEVVSCCGENIKEKIHKYKQQARCVWPELHLYCGVCDLKTGLYIRSVLGVFIYIVVLTINVVMLYYIMSMGRFLYEMDLEDLEEYLGFNFTDVNLSQSRVQNMYTLVVTYFILWIIFKLFYIMALFSTIFAIYKKKPKILKIVLFINTLNWVLDVIISIFGAVILRVVSKLLLIACLLFEGYNILAIGSKYKQLRGKSKLLMNMNQTNHENIEAVTPSADQVSSRTNHDAPRHLRNWKHCETCSCNHEPLLPVVSDSGSSAATASGTNLNQSVNEEKQMNIKDIEIIFNQDQLLPQYSCLLQNPQRANESPVNSANFQRVANLNSLEQISYNFDEKIGIATVPIIYDENQLQVSGSPVIENRGTWMSEL